MQFRKIAAVAGSALMTGMTLAGAAMAATTVGTIANLATPSDSVANYPLLVVGKTAATADVAGAINIALKLAASSKATTAAAGVAAAIDGVERDGIQIGGASGGRALSTAITGGAAFPSSAIIKNAHFSTLKDSTFSWKSSDYDYREQVDMGTSAAGGGVAIRNDLGTDKINGTATMVIGANDVVYEFVFEKALNMSTSASDTTCTIATPEYTDPVKIKMLGKDFTIVGVGATSIKMLSGATGTAKKQGTTMTGITSGAYTVYVTSGANNDWASFEVKKADGTLVESVSGISEGNSKDASVSGLTIKVTDVRVAGTDPSTAIFEADVVVGPTGTTEHEYDNTADVDATGTSNEAFPGAARWGIQYSVTGGSNCYIPNGAKIQVTYKPGPTDTTEYYKAGSKVSLPNSYGELGFTGYNTAKFATITIKPVSSQSVYFQSNASTMSAIVSGMTGLEISSDLSGAIVSPASNFYTKAYVLFNATRNGDWPVAIGYPDTAGKILVNDSFPAAAQNDTYNQTSGGYEYAFARLMPVATGQHLFNYTFKINAGDTDFFLNVRIAPGNTTIINRMAAGDASDDTIVMGFQNRSPWTISASPEFKLGASLTSAEETELNVTTEGSSTPQNAGKKSQDEIVDDSGVLVLNPASNGASDQVRIKVPSKTLGIKAYFGKTGTTTTTTTTDKVVAVTADVARLDSEVSDADKTASNMILVGGPCVNTLVGDLAVAGKFPYGCPEKGVGTVQWPGENLAVVKVIEDAFATGKVAVVVAGTRAQDTDLAARAIQAGKLDAQTGTSVTIKGESIETMTVS